MPFRPPLPDRARLVLPLAAALGLAALPAPAEPTLSPAHQPWSVARDFAKPDKDEEARKRPRMNLSGAACVPTRPRFASCLIVNDEKKYAQFFSIDHRTLAPGALIRLTDRSVRGDPDAEGVAYADGFFYVIGSHGRTRYGDEAGDSRFVVLRFPVDPATGKPRFRVSEDEVVGVEASTRLRETIRDAEGVGPFYDKPLGENGVNIEGIAVRNGRMLLGFRGPSVDGQAFILSVDAAAVFTPGEPLDPKVFRLALGPSTGIRDLAPVRDGFLVLSGPVNDQPVTPALSLWNETSGALKPLGTLAPAAGLPDGAKAETVLVLRDRARRDWRLLILYDGAENGFPTEYRVGR